MSIVAQNRSKVAYTFGTADARHGASCLPELYFAHPADKLEYVTGFESVAGETLLSRQIKQLFGGRN